jgi:hypothetical protein
MDTDELNAFGPFGPCTCKEEYSIEPHGDGYALYHGRCNHRHGYNLFNIKEVAFNCDLKLIEDLLNHTEAEEE